VQHRATVWRLCWPVLASGGWGSSGPANRESTLFQYYLRCSQKDTNMSLHLVTFSRQTPADQTLGRYGKSVTLHKNIVHHRSNQHGGSCYGYICHVSASANSIAPMIERRVFVLVCGQPFDGCLQNGISSCE
jgi:hypothetical protein